MWKNAGPRYCRPRRFSCRQSAPRGHGGPATTDGNAREWPWRTGPGRGASGPWRWRLQAAHSGLFPGNHVLSSSTRSAGSPAQGSGALRRLWRDSGEGADLKPTRDTGVPAEPSPQVSGPCSPRPSGAEAFRGVKALSRILAWGTAAQ